jgi:hypothetical protein
VSRTGVPAGNPGLPDAEVYRTSAVEAYYARPRGSLGAGFDPERRSPRWRWVLVAMVALAITLAAGLLIRVPVGPVGTFLGVNGSRAVLAMPTADAPRPGERVRLRVDGRSLSGEVREVQASGGSTLLVMALVDLDTAPADLATGGPVTIDQGDRPLLLDLLKGDDAA